MKLKVPYAGVHELKLRIETRQGRAAWNAQ